jgi:hypothetical protein
MMVGMGRSRRGPVMTMKQGIATAVCIAILAVSAIVEVVCLVADI